MNKTIANFLTQPNKDFPLDCETLHCMQMNGSIHEILGNIGGDKIILLGCAQANNNTTRNEGYVFFPRNSRGFGAVLPEKYRSLQ